MNGVGCEDGIEAPCCVTLEGAVASVLAVKLLFVAWACAFVGVLHRSRNAVHLRSGAPIVGIALGHSLTKPELLQASRLTVDTGHGHRRMCGGLGSAVQCELVFAQRHVAEQWLTHPHLCSSGGW